MKELKKKLIKGGIKILKTNDTELTLAELSSLRKLTLHIREKIKSVRREIIENGKREEDRYVKNISKIILSETLKIKTREISQNMLDVLSDEFNYYKEEANDYGALIGEATKDPLTGLYNRRMFLRLLNLYKGEAKFKKQRLALLMIDIDLFKRLNDLYGHIEGDKILQDISDILSTCVKDQDVVARYGGEEFIIILKNTDKKRAKIVAKRILQRIRDYNPHLHYIEMLTLRGKKKIVASWKEEKVKREKITISIGISLYPSEIDKDTILMADEALYYSKKKGRDRITSYE